MDVYAPQKFLTPSSSRGFINNGNKDLKTDQNSLEKLNPIQTGKSYKTKLGNFTEQGPTIHRKRTSLLA